MDLRSYISTNNADPALYDVFWLDRWRHRASLQLYTRGLRENAGASAEFELSEHSLVDIHEP